MSETFNRTNVEYDGRTYPAVELLNFTTADNVVVEYGLFTTTDFMDLNNESSEYLSVDEKVYGYLPRKFIEKEQKKKSENILKRKSDKGEHQ